MSTAERSTPRLEPRPPRVDEDDEMTVPDHLVVALMITDPALVRKLKAEREQSPSAPRDEVWDGVYVMSPSANLEHQVFSQELWLVFREVLAFVGGGIAYNVLNVSDRVEGWKENYREPGVGVYLATNPARNCGTHMCGGPDFAVEILSEGDLARKKLVFYAKVDTRELLLLDRDPWALELYRLAEGQLKLVGVSTPEQPGVLTSEVLPLTFRLVPGEGRPTLELCRLDGGHVRRI
jgi:Putative restriction endonuclease